MPSSFLRHSCKPTAAQPFPGLCCDRWDCCPCSSLRVLRILTHGHIIWQRTSSTWACELTDILPRQWPSLPLASPGIYASPRTKGCFYMTVNCLLPMMHLPRESIKNPLFHACKSPHYDQWYSCIISNEHGYSLNLHVHAACHITPRDPK